MKKIFALLIAFVMVFVLVGHVHAIPITVVNSGFESGSGWTSTPGVSPIPGWTKIGATGNGGSDTPSSGWYTSLAPEGSKVGFTNQNAGLSQLFGDTLVANTQYTLEVFVGRRKFSAAFNDYSVELLAGGTILATTNGSTASPAMDSFINAQVVFSTGASHLLLGQQLEINLRSVSGLVD